MGKHKSDIDYGIIGARVKELRHHRTIRHHSYTQQKSDRLKS